jgi:hypothetical protein
MTTLGGLALSADLVLNGLENAPDLAFSQRRTLAGVSVVQSAPVLSGRVLTLESDGHLTLAQVQAIKALAAAGQEVALVHSRGSFTVLIVGVSVEPVFESSDPEATLWHSGEITLIEV